jgi:exodeoxyribonuclease-1
LTIIIKVFAEPFQMQSIFWHDYETFGADPRRDRPCQFAGIRTDLELNIISEPLTIYAKPVDDYLPSIEACLVTGITPQEATNKGVVEAEFASRILAEFSQPETCVAGYNSIRFDDEVSRNLFYRNLADPYEREWKDGNSRWDLIDVMRMAHALRPEGIEWPVGDDGKVSFRLEKLTEANGISHEMAHDAMSDVYATIAIAKLLKEKQPQLYRYAFDMRTKSACKSFLEENWGKPFLHFSSKFPVVNGCCAMVFPIMMHPTNQNAVVVFDLRQDPEILLNLNSDELKQRLYMKVELDLSGNPKVERPALKLIHLNKCPMLAPASMVKTISSERLSEWGMELDGLRKNAKKLKEIGAKLGHLAEVFDSDDDFESPTDPDLMIYSGGFLSPADKRELSKIRGMSEHELADAVVSFQDSRLDEMLFRYKARSFPESLNSDERERWEEFRRQRLLSSESGFRDFTTFAKDLQRIASVPELSSNEVHILQELQTYAESIYPY